MNRLVYLKPRFNCWPLHTLYRDLVRRPPNGFTIVHPRVERGIAPIRGIDRKGSPFTNLTYYLKPLPYLIVESVSPCVIPEGCSLIFSSQHVLSIDFPWLVDLEFADALAGYADLTLVRAALEKALSRPSCRGIMPWSDWAEATLRRSLDCRSFSDKIRVVRYCVDPERFEARPKGKKEDGKEETHRNRDGWLNLLFVGSANEANAKNFEIKGGLVALHAFLRLRRKYDKLRLIIRSWVPPSVKLKALSCPDITILDRPLSEDGLHDLYERADIFVFPAHETMGVVILETMAHGLPVVALDVYDIPEAVRDGYNGLLLTKPKEVPYYTKNGCPNDHSRDFIMGIRAAHESLVRELVEKLSQLIESDAYRRRLGRNGRYEVEEGRFSIKARNELLGSIFEEALRA